MPFPLIKRLLVLLCWLPAIALAQFNSPTVSSVLAPNTWGGTGNPNNYVGGASVTWYLTWDDTYLYCFVSGGNEAETATIYLDVDPIVPVNGGSNSDGSLAGAAFDGVTPDLPFRGDIGIFFRGSYREIYRRNGSGGWTSIGSGNGAFSATADDYANGAYASNTNGGAPDTRMFRISWSRLMGSINGGLRPAAFNWLGYQSFGSGNSYGQIPSLNPSGATTSPDCVRYLSVISTADGQNGATPNPAIGRESYTFLGGADITSFGTVTLHDMTINNSGRFLSRGTGGGNWTIGGTLVVGAGTLFFGPSGTFGSTNVGTLRIVGGTLDMDATNQPMVVSAGLVMTGGTLELSSTVGGDINLSGGNWNRSGGTFTPSSRAVGFTSTTSNQSILNAESFAFLSTTKGTFELQASGNLTVTNGLALISGDLKLQGNTLTMGSSAVVATVATGSNRVYNSTGITRFVNGVTTPISIPLFLGSVNRSISLEFASGNGAGASVSLRHTDYASTPTHPGLSNTNFGDAALVAAGITNAQKVAPFIWDVTGTAITAPSYTMTVTASSMNSVADPDLLRLLRRTDATQPYALAGTHVSGTGSAGNYSVQASGMTSFSEFTVANGGPELLPVSWLGVAARRVGAGAEVIWGTASETNNARFEVERSTSAQFTSFQQVGTLPGAGTTQQVRSYRFVDPEIGSGSYFYRIRQVDLDGQSSRSPVVQLRASEYSADARILVYPTVLSGGPLQMIALEGEQLTQQPMHARLVSAHGQLVWQGYGQLAELQTRANAALAAAAAGFYLLQLEGEQLRQQTRLIRQ